MADPVKIKLKGSTLDTLELTLENFSTEQTLQKLLDQFLIFTTKYSGGTVSSTTESTSDDVDQAKQSLSGFTKAIAAADIEVWLIAKGAQALEGILSLVSQSVTSLFSVTGNMISAFVQGKTALSDYADALAKGTANLPIIGEFFAIIAAGLNILEKWNQTLYQLNQFGASFNGSISGLIQGAAEARLTLEQYSKVITTNADKFVAFGSVMEGVNVYTRIANRAISQYANQIADMGMSVQEFSEELPGVLSLFAASAKARGATDKEITDSAIELTEQFNAMAKITGKTREQQAADLQALTADAAWQQKMNSVSKNQQAGYINALSEIRSTMGESYAELYKFSVLGMPPLNKEMQTLLATMPDLAPQFETMTNIVKKGGVGMGEALDRQATTMVSSALRHGASFEQLIAASATGLSGTADQIAKAQQELLSHTKEYMNQDGTLNEQRYSRMLEQNRREAEANAADKPRRDEIQKTLTQFSADMSKLQEDFTIHVLVPLLEKVSPMIEGIITSFENNQGLIYAVFDRFADWVQQLGDWIGNHGQDIQDSIKGLIIVITNIVKFLMTVVEWMFKHWELVKAILVVTLGVIAGIIVAAISPFIEVIAAVTAIITLIWSVGSLLSSGYDWLASKIPWGHGKKTPDAQEPATSSIIPWGHNKNNDNSKTPTGSTLIPTPPPTPGKAVTSAGTPIVNKVDTSAFGNFASSGPSQEQTTRMNALLQNISNGIDSLVRSNRQIAAST